VSEEAFPLNSLHKCVELQTAHGKYLILKLWVTGQLHTKQVQSRARIYSHISFAFDETRSEGGRHPCGGQGEGDSHARRGGLADASRATRGE
jgi:hypothetical protein